GEQPSPARIGVRLARFGAKSVPLYAYEELIAEAERDEAAESCRLAYVAATRARDRLLLSGCFAPDKVAQPPPDDELPVGTPVTERLLGGLGVDQAERGAGGRPAPPPRPGLEARLGPARLAIDVNVPEPEAFRALGGSAAPEPEA